MDIYQERLEKKQSIYLLLGQFGAFHFSHSTHAMMIFIGIHHVGRPLAY
jgi:hypothetical protein